MPCGLKRLVRICGVLVGIFVVWGTVYGQPRRQDSPSIALPVEQKNVAADLFALNIINLTYGVVWPANMPLGSWRNFNSAWVKVEGGEGRWDFEELDKNIELAGQHRTPVVLVLGTTPTWASARPKEEGYNPPHAPKGSAAEPRRLEDWQNYVRTVATRYKGRVQYYELWNEPNVKRAFSGTIDQLLRLNREAYRVLKAVDRDIVVVSSALAPCCNSFDYLDAYLAKGGGQYADVIGYHFYVAPRPPEAMLPDIKKVKWLMAKHGVAKPLWNTETGWRVINSDKNIGDEQWAGSHLAAEDGAAYVARSYILSWAAGVERLYWYAWGHRSMGMTEYDGKTPKPIAIAFRETRNWLVGSRMIGCGNDKENTWSCEIMRDGGYRGRILWNPDKKITVEVGDAENVRHWRDLGGQVHLLNGARCIEVGASPILVESVAQ